MALSTCDKCDQFYVLDEAEASARMNCPRCSGSMRVATSSEIGSRLYALKERILQEAMRRREQWSGRVVNRRGPQGA